MGALTAAKHLDAIADLAFQLVRASPVIALGVANVEITGGGLLRPGNL
jgi:hypothetical protein